MSKANMLIEESSMENKDQSFDSLLVNTIKIPARSTVDAVAKKHELLESSRLANSLVVFKNGFIVFSLKTFFDKSGENTYIWSFERSLSQFRTDQIVAYAKVLDDVFHPLVVFSVKSEQREDLFKSINKNLLDSAIDGVFVLADPAKTGRLSVECPRCREYLETIPLKEYELEITSNNLVSVYILQIPPHVCSF